MSHWRCCLVTELRDHATVRTQTCTIEQEPCKESCLIRDFGIAEWLHRAVYGQVMTSEPCSDRASRNRFDLEVRQVLGRRVAQDQQFDAHNCAIANPCRNTVVAGASRMTCVTAGRLAHALSDGAHNCDTGSDTGLKGHLNIKTNRPKFSCECASLRDGQATLGACCYMANEPFRART
jgi:hypothetical protein